MKIAAIQMNSQDNKEHNYAEAERLVRAAAKDGASLIVLPEYFAYLSVDNAAQRESGELLGAGELSRRLSALARELKITLHAGSMVERDGDARYNATAVFDPRGELIARYRKIHLFDVEVPGGLSYLESAWVDRGRDVVTYRVGDVTVGCAICYDIRFPEMFRQLRDLGCDVIVLPAAFTAQTGKDHWEVLSRARAIETQTYFVACGQVLGHGGGVKSCWGHSMIVDPWGCVVAQASDRVGFTAAEIDLDYVRTIRQNVPVANHHVL
ncbi:carbon-nitrogen hydrolase family protein [Burkholderia cenocepacia]|uniref:carbon-nitrogen hydrolase family protein n=1 Tax=Burkholderia cenocepacia TaxID=95486 RepID=UPI001B9867B4|nr:carbon-nitrogen hydrolase family protein [Burkholderia cenocepacia]MBR8168001.1 carbon-nitrogen hydrolase family protein [Burkholderia cenocepacia]